jgi:hypothetical protein
MAFRWKYEWLIHQSDEWPIYCVRNIFTASSCQRMKWQRRVQTITFGSTRWQLEGGGNENTSEKAF